jgi:hypothetical protein
MIDTTEQIASVIDLTNQLEVQINLALSECIVPVSTEYGFLRETLFHNLCLGFGAKVRLLQRIIDYWNWKETKLDDFHKLMQLRNAFAHTPTTKRVLLVSADPETGEHHPLASQLVVDRKYKTHWQEMERAEAFQDFLAAHQSCDTIVKDLTRRIRETIAEQENQEELMDNVMKFSQTAVAKESIISLLDELIQNFLAETSNITFNKYNIQHLYLMCLYGRIFELGVSALNLMKANDHAGIPVILRSQLEAFVDFANLIEDKDFIKTIAATFVDQKKRLYENLKKHLAPSEIPSVTNDGTEKVADGYKPQKIWKRFKNIKLQKTYITAYFILCGYGHNNLAMLEHRHLEKTEKDHKVVFFKEEPFLIFLRFAFTLGATLVDSHKNLLDFFDKSMEEESNLLCSKFSQLRKDAKVLFKNGE